MKTVFLSTRAANQLARDIPRALALRPKGKGRLLLCVLKHGSFSRNGSVVVGNAAPRGAIRRPVQIPGRLKRSAA